MLPAAGRRASKRAHTPNSSRTDMVEDRDPRAQVDEQAQAFPVDEVSTAAVLVDLVMSLLVVGGVGCGGGTTSLGLGVGVSTRSSAGGGFRVEVAG